MKTFEQAVQHIRAANGSAWNIDFETVAEGLEDALHRLQHIEAAAKAPPATPAKPK